MTCPLVSVIMTVYNAENHIRESIQSVLSQTHRAFQFIIVDDGSTDGTADLVRSFSDPRIEFYQLSENRHIAYASNVAYEKIRGDYMAIIDGDDIWCPDKLEKQLKFLAQHPELRGCFTWVDLIDENGASCNDKLPALREMFSSHTGTQESWLRDFFFIGKCPNNPSALIEAATIPAIGPHSLFYIQATDMEWWVRFTKKFAFGILEEPLTKYRRILSSDANASSRTLEHDTRFYNEYMHIRFHFFDDMEDDLFIRAFGSCFRNPDAHTPEELACEKAFLLCNYQEFSKSTPLGLLKIEELLDHPYTANILREQYHFTTRDCGQLTCRHVYNDWHLQNLEYLRQKSEGEIQMLNQQLKGNQEYIEKLTEEIGSRQYAIERSRLQIEALTQCLDENQKQLAQKDADIAQRNTDIAQKNAELSLLRAEATGNRQQIEALTQRAEALEQSLGELTTSTSWKLTAPLRKCKALFKSK